MGKTVAPLTPATLTPPKAPPKRGCINCGGKR
jgi:hypothetical protein